MTSQEHLEALYTELGQQLAARKRYYEVPASRGEGGEFCCYSHRAVDEPIDVTLQRMLCFVNKASLVTNEKEVQWDV
jgi:hypothetical protein